MPKIIEDVENRILCAARQRLLGGDLSSFSARGIAEACGTDLDDAGAEAALHRALAVKCARVLADAGVYKHTPEGDAGLLRFLRSIGYQTV